MCELTTDAAMIRYLCRYGNLSVPGGRYGHDTETCAPVAVAIARIHEDANGDPITTEMLDEFMGYVVNSSDSVASLLRAHGTVEQCELYDIPRYVVVENTPGYLPESDPAEFVTFAEAEAYAFELEADYDSVFAADVTGSAADDYLLLTIRSDQGLPRVIEVSRIED